MRDVVMEAVEEVLHRQPPSEETAGVQNSAEGIARPNYQRQSREKRLQFYELGPELARTMLKGAWQPAVPQENGAMEQPFQTLLLVNRQIRSLLKTAAGGQEAACIGYLERGSMSAFFAIAAALEEEKILDYDLQWTPGQDSALAFQAAGRTERMRTLAGRLNSMRTGGSGICLSRGGEQIIRRFLNVGCGRVGAVEGVHYMKLLPALARYLEEHGTETIACKAVGSCLFLTGEETCVKGALSALAEGKWEDE